MPTIDAEPVRLRVEKVDIIESNGWYRKKVLLTVDTLRYCEESGARCGECPSGVGENGVPNCHSQARIADLIEALAAELEQVKRECDGLSIMLTSATSAAETYKRERDAAVKDLHLWGCFSCKHAGYAHSEICASCVYNRNRIAKGCASGKNRYEWRGVKEDLHEP